MVCFICACRSVGVLCSHGSIQCQVLQSLIGLAHSASLAKCSKRPNYRWSSSSYFCFIARNRLTGCWTTCSPPGTVVRRSHQKCVKRFVTLSLRTISVYFTLDGQNSFVRCRIKLELGIILLYFTGLFVCRSDSGYVSAKFSAVLYCLIVFYLYLIR